MKTNNVIIRPMGQFQVQQRTKDGMFNATALLKQLNIANKSVQGFIDEQISFEKEFKGESTVEFGNDGKNIWMSPRYFGMFLLYLDNHLYEDFLREDAFNVKFSEFFRDYPCAYGISAAEAQRYTYIATDASGFYKIGSSDDVKHRLKAFAVGNPTIKLVLILKGDVEKELHQLFENKRVGGEWFGLLSKDIEYIRENYTPALLQ